MKLLPNNHKADQEFSVAILELKFQQAVSGVIYDLSLSIALTVFPIGPALFFTADSYK